MADYILREVAVKIAERYGLTHGSVLGRHSGIADCIASEIEAIPAADVVEVVRCKGCKYHREPDKDEQKYLCQGVLVCTNADFLDDGWNTVWPEDFCSYGKRRNE